MQFLGIKKTKQTNTTNKIMGKEEMTVPIETELLQADRHSTPSLKVYWRKYPALSQQSNMRTVKTEEKLCTFLKKQPSCEASKTNDLAQYYYKGFNI